MKEKDNKKALSLNFTFFESKMDNLNKRKIIAGLLISLVVIGLFFSFFLYQNQKKNQKVLLREKLNYDSAVKALVKEKQDLTALATSLGINYFSRFPESSQMDFSFFLFNRISALANKWGVNLLSFSPAEKETKGNYSIISFSGTISASFSDMVNFFQELEDKEKFALDNLKINTNSQSPRIHQAEFDLVCLEFNDPMLKVPAEKGQGPNTAQPEKKKIETAQRDPFFNASQKIKVSQPTEKNKEGLDDLSTELSLTGINYSATSRTAIINHQMVKEGGMIEGKRVIEIKKDEVVLKAGEQRYTLRLKETLIPQKKKDNPLEKKEAGN